MSTVRIFKPVYVYNELGELAVVPDGGIINIGGTSNPTFTVGGRGLLFDDGTSTSGVIPSPVSLQAAYTNSGFPAQIDTVLNKDLVFNALNSNKFVFDASTGAVTIQGNLTVLGTSTVVEGTISNLDQVNINPPSSGTVGLVIAPVAGVTPSVNLVEIRTAAGGAPVFSVGPTGTTTVTNLVAGTLNGTDVDDIIDHLNSDVLPAKHTGEQVSVDTSSFSTIRGENVQEALQDIDEKITSLVTNNVIGYQHVQASASATWTINHMKDSRRIQLTVWGPDDKTLIPDEVAITSSDTIVVKFGTALAGRAILMIF